MKKFICMLLVVVMMLSLVACGGKTEPVTTTPTVETVIDTPDISDVSPDAEGAPLVETNPTTEDKPTEPVIERVEPTDFEPVDPASLPDPNPVEKQLQSDDTQTIVLDSLAEYEDFLWNMGFKEVRLSNASCEPVSLTYNNQVFRFDYMYYVDKDGKQVKENWHMYGEKASCLANIADLNMNEYYQVKQTNAITINIGEGQSIEDFLASFDPSQIDMTTANEAKTTTPNYEEELLSFGSNTEFALLVNVKAVYYPITGNLYNYMQDWNDDPATNFLGSVDSNLNYSGEVSNESKTYGAQAINMCLHYLFPEE